MSEWITRIIKKKRFTNYFQPIIDLRTKEMAGYESLFRSPAVSNPETLFRLAHKNGCGWALDMASIRNSFCLFRPFFIINRSEGRRDLSLFVNVFPSTLIHHDFFLFLETAIRECPLPLENIVFEINEAEFTVDLDRLKKATDELRERGFRIAIDDVGKGYSTLSRISDLNPDALKMDKSFSQNLHREKIKQQQLRAFLEFADEDIDLILEGIEKQEDLDAARGIGFQYGQGYFIGRPGPLKINDT